MSAGPPEPPWQITYTDREALFDEVRRLAGLAEGRGIRGALFDAIRLFYDRLTNDPLGWGDPLWRARHADVVVYRGMQPPLRVTYAAHEASRTVWILDIIPLAGYRLDE